MRVLIRFVALALGALLLAAVVVSALWALGLTGPLPRAANLPPPTGAAAYAAQTAVYTPRSVALGRQVFRYDTFGSEAFWGEALRLHEALAGEKLGGVGEGLTPRAALGLGLKVDAEALPSRLVKDLRQGRVNLADPATTLALLKLNAVMGVTGFFDGHGNLTSAGIQCALCHSTVDDSLAPGIGWRLDGWANRDLNVGGVIALAPNLRPFADLLGVDEATVRVVLMSWGPGKFDALLSLDGKAFRPDGRSAAVLIPPAYGLSGVNLHTWTGFGSVPYWNAYVANLQMHGLGTFFDERLNDPVKYPLAVRAGEWNVRSRPDLITAKLVPLHAYQLALPAPKAPPGSYDPLAARRGEAVFAGPGKCVRCHVPPLFVEPGNHLHLPAELGIDSFQADRSPTGRYRTPPLKGLWAHQKGGFFHDGRFPTLLSVVDHYDVNLNLGLTRQQKSDLVEFLKSL